MTLADAVLDLVGTFGRDGDRGHLTLTDAPAPGPAGTTAATTDPADAPPALADYLAAVDVGRGTAIGGVLALELAGRADLPRLQEGRAVVHVHGEPRADTSWPASWVVTSPWTARPASAARSRFACRRGAWPDAVGPIGAGVVGDGDAGAGPAVGEGGGGSDAGRAAGDEHVHVVAP